MISRRNLSLLINRKTVTAVVVLGALLIVAAVVVFFFYARSRSTPKLEITPPQSLAELAEQYPALAPILTDPELDSVYKEFLIAYEEGGMDAARELAQQRDMLTPQGDVAVTLILDTEDHAALKAQLAAAGVTVASAYRDRVNVAVPLALIEAQLQTEAPGAIFDQLTELDVLARGMAVDVDLLGVTNRLGAVDSRLLVDGDRRTSRNGASKTLGERDVSVAGRIGHRKDSVNATFAPSVT